MLLTSTRRQVVHNVTCAVPCAEVTYKVDFSDSKKSKSSTRTLLDVRIVLD